MDTKIDKELQQQKHYAYLSQLQSMARELPVWVELSVARRAFCFSVVVPMSTRTLPTRTQIISYPMPIRNHAISYPVPTSTHVNSYPSLYHNPKGLTRGYKVTCIDLDTR